jgi:hypothetical protein
MSRDSAAIEESSNLTARLCPWKRFHLAGVQFLDTPRDLEIPCLFDGRIHGIVETLTTGVMRLFYALSKINLWPNFWRSQIATAPISGAIKSYVVSSTLSKLSIGEVVRNVKLLGKIISAFSPQNEFLHKRRMDPAGFEPASATWTERHVPVTPRALSAVSRSDHANRKVLGHNLPADVPN